MASHCMKPSTGLLHLAVWCLLCLDDITTTGPESMVICDSGPCGVGERFDPTTSACFPCDQGSFMDRQNHKCLQCIRCIEPNQLEHELVLRNCTDANDTEIGCDGLHYMKMLDDLREPYCEKCTECGVGQWVKQTCGPNSDTVCVNNEVDTTHDIKTTRPESMVICDNGTCGVGERFDPTTSACFPCDQGSFMDRQNHKCLQCIPCIEPNQLEHELVLRNCTATSDTEIGCDDLHYKKVLDDLREPYCDRCTECGVGQRVEQTCGPNSDTVCVNNEVDTTLDKGGSFNVSGNSPQLADKNTSTDDINTRRIYSDNAFANKRGPHTFHVVLPLIFVCIAAIIIIIIMLIYKQRLQSICKPLPKLLYDHMKKNARGSQISLCEDSQL